MISCLLYLRSNLVSLHLILEIRWPNFMLIERGQNHQGGLWTLGESKEVCTESELLKQSLCLYLLWNQAGEAHTDTQRERERDRERDTCTNTHTHKHKDTQTHTDADRHTHTGTLHRLFHPSTSICSQAVPKFWWISQANSLATGEAERLITSVWTPEVSPSPGKNVHVQKRQSSHCPQPLKCVHCLSEKGPFDLVNMSVGHAKWTMPCKQPSWNYREESNYFSCDYYP